MIEPSVIVKHFLHTKAILPLLAIDRIDTYTTGFNGVSMQYTSVPQIKPYMGNRLFERIDIIIIRWFASFVGAKTLNPRALISSNLY